MYKKYLDTGSKLIIISWFSMIIAMFIKGYNMRYVPNQTTYISTTTHSITQRGNKYIIVIPSGIIITEDEYTKEVLKASLSSAGLLDNKMKTYYSVEELNTFLEAYNSLGGEEIIIKKE